MMLMILAKHSYWVYVKGTFFASLCGVFASFFCLLRLILLSCPFNEMCIIIIFKIKKRIELVKFEAGTYIGYIFEYRICRIKLERCRVK